MQQWPQTHLAALLVHAILGAQIPPLPRECIDITLPSAHGADSAPHLLLQAGSHSLLAGVGEVNTSNIAEPPSHHILNDVLPHPRLIRVDRVDSPPPILQTLDVPYHRTI